MQLFSDSGDIDRAIEELKRDLPLVALQSIVENRTRRHGKTSELRRLLKLMKARQIVKEASAA